tara:strand:+ start:62667 stop:63233 length:567 start_codon:yes stop_codon:yes gene_type:complete
VSIPEVGSKNRLLAFLQKYVRTLDNLNYRGPGAIIGYHRYTSSAIVTTETSSTTMDYALNGSDKITITFEAPPSGVVEIACSVFANPGNNDYGKLGLSDNGTTFSIYTPIGDPTDSEAIFYYADESDLEYMTAKWLLPGLTPHASYTFYLGYSVHTVGHTFEIRWGGIYPSMLLTATSLPANTTLTNS